MALALSVIGVVLLIYLLLLCPAVIKADLNREPVFVLRYLFFKFRLYPKKEKPKKTKAKKNRAATESKKGNRSMPKGISYYIDKYGEIVKAVFSAAGKLLKHITVNRMELDVVVGGEDAAEVAVEYGAVCAIAYPICSIIQSNVTVKESIISIKPDFDAKTSNGGLYLDVRIKAFHVAAALFALASHLFKYARK